MAAHWSEVHSANNLEIRYVCDSLRDPSPLADGKHWQFLGFDAAGTEDPFWSVVGDFPADEAVRPFLDDLNADGLFNSGERTSAYLAAYRQHQRAEYDTPLTIWAVFGTEYRGNEG